MLRCVGVVRAVQQVSRNAGALKQNHSKLSYSIRNFSHINPNVASSLLLTHRSGISANQVRFESSGATEFVLDNIPGPKTVLESFPHSNPLLENIPQTSPLLDNIPEPPVIPDLVTKVTEAIVSGAEPAFSTLGFGGWTPVGIVQNCMEFLHIGCDLPWWTCVMIGTVFVRTIIFPLVIVSQRNSAKMSNNMPQIQHLQAKMTEARQSGNAIDAARFSQEMVTYMKEKELNPLKNLVVPLAQAPLFISFFIGLRQMANAPVESLRDGGLFWFVDLTVPDQFFLLPIITSFTMLATIEVGTDGARLASANLQTMKYVLRALPFVILPFTINFPGIILAYWTCSNFISLAQVGFLKVPKVREYFKIDKLIVHKPSELAKKKGFREGIKDSWTNMKITRELEERKRIDEIIFQRAAKGAVQKTYKYDPTKPRNAPTPMHAKKV